MAPLTHPDGPDVHARPGRPAAAGGPAVLRGARGAGAPLGVGAAGLVAVAYLAATDPYRPGGHLVCPVLALTGLYCAGCGGQRAVHDLAHGDVAAAWGMNPLVVVGAPLVLLVWAAWLRRRWLGAPAVAGGRGTAAWVLLAVVVAFAVLRNVPALAPVLAP